MVWKLAADSNKDLVIRTAIDYFKDHFVAQRMASNWVSPPLRIEGKSKRVRDFVSWMMSAPVVSERAKLALQPVIRDSCEILPLTQLRGKLFYVLNVLSIVDCLDHARSRIVYADDDPAHVLAIERYFFDERRVPADAAIFKIPDDLGCVFVTKLFVDAVLAHELAGASFHDPGIEPFGEIIQGRSLNVVPGLPP